MSVSDAVGRRLEAVGDFWRRLEPAQRRNLAVGAGVLALGLVVLLIVNRPWGGGGEALTTAAAPVDVDPFQGPVAERDLAALRTMPLDDLRQLDAQRRADLDRLRSDPAADPAEVRQAEAAVERSSLILEQRANRP